MGIAKGPVRIIRDSSEFGKLRSGGISVAPHTNRAWTQHFQRAAAVVMSSGGQRHTQPSLRGDQFTVLLEDVASVGDTVRVARRIEEGLRRPLDLGGLERAVTTSIGIGLSTPQWEPHGEIVRRADAAMYRTKEARRARYAVPDPGANQSISP